MPTSSPSVRSAGAAPATDTPPASITGRALVLVLVLITLVMSLAFPVREFFGQRARAAELAASTAATEARIAELTALERRWDDPAYVIARARERLGMARPGEIAYVVSAGGPAPAVAPPPAVEVPWWQRLWRTITRSGG